MAGMDWFRWHHGCVTDPKFQLIAKKAGASVAEVLAVWACLLEAASQAETRGNPGEPDFEAIDCALGLDEGKAQAIYSRMNERGLLREDGAIAAWEKRQPKREREGDSSADRTRAYRERQKTHGDTDADDVTPCDATSRQKKPREEKSREEERNTPPTPKGGVDLPGFANFWQAWPPGDRKQARGKCLEVWKKAGAEPHAALVVAHVERMKASASWTKNNGEYIPAPLVYLNRRSWEGAEASELPAQESFV